MKTVQGIVLLVISCALFACGGGGGGGTSTDNNNNTPPVADTPTTPAWTKLSIATYTYKIFKMVVDPTDSQTVYACGSIVTQNGNAGIVYKSSDGGLTWSTTTTINGFIQDIEIDSTNHNIVYVASDDAVSKSVDGGLSWSKVSSGFPQYGDTVQSIAISTTNNQVVYAGLSANGGGGVYKSTNGGNSWTTSSTGIYSPLQYAGGGTSTVYSIAIDPSNNSTVYAATDNGVFKSTDAGATWVGGASGISIQDLSINSITIDPINSQTVYIMSMSRSASNFGAIYKSTNGGSSWVPITGVIPRASSYRNIVIDNTNNQVLYALVGGSVYKSTNAGSSWLSTSTLSSNTPFAVNSFAIAPSNTKVIYAGVGSTDGVVWKSTTGGF